MLHYVADGFLGIWGLKCGVLQWKFAFNVNFLADFSQLTFTRSKSSTIETLEKSMKYIET